MNGWQVEYDDEFYAEVQTYPEDVQDKLAAMALLLEAVGPQLSRPRADTLKGIEAPEHEGASLQGRKAAWRVAFAFDPERNGILLTGGNKQGCERDQVL